MDKFNQVIEKNWYQNFFVIAYDCLMLIGKNKK